MKIIKNPFLILLVLLVIIIIILIIYNYFNRKSNNIETFYYNQDCNHFKLKSRSPDILQKCCENIRDLNGHNKEYCL